MATGPQPTLPFASTGLSLFALGLLALGVLPGCGRASAAQPAGEAPTSALESSKSEPETLEQAETELEQARQQLAQLGGIAAAPPPPPAAAPAAQAPAASGVIEPSSAREEAKRKQSVEAEASPPPAPEARAARPADKADDYAQPENDRARDENPCVNTCKAYASLLRAKNAVCRLDVPNGARCARAEGIVRDATPHVQSCQCAP